MNTITIKINPNKEVTLDKLMDCYENRRHAQYFAKTFREHLAGEKSIHFAEFPYEEVSKRHSYRNALVDVLSVMYDFSQISDILVYFAGCRCCFKETWVNDFISKTQARRYRKIILVYEADTGNNDDEYKKLMSARITFTEISLNRSIP